MASAAPGPAEIAAAQARIAPHVLRTPVLLTRELGLSFPVALKLEQMQLTGSFKARGAFNSLLSLDLPAAGVVAASGGNHGAAVAAAAARLGVPARIFVPELAGAAKIALIRAQGAGLEVVPGYYADAFARAEAHATATGAILIHAYDAPATLAKNSCRANGFTSPGLSIPRENDARIPSASSAMAFTSGKVAAKALALASKISSGFCVR